MGIILVGLNYRTAPVELREQFSIPESAIEDYLKELLYQDGIEEAVLVSTCNRTEIYVVADTPTRALSSIETLLATLSHVNPQEFRTHLYQYQDLHAVKHLLRVVTGLDSMVVGETQILGQVRTAFLTAQQHHATGHIFNVLFRDAIAFGKRVQTETSIGQSAVSVSYAAVSLAKKVFGTLSQQTVLVVGAGKMADLTIKHLQAQGVERVLIVNRTFARAQEKALQYGGQALSIDRLADALCEADIVISSSGGQDYLIHPQVLAKRMTTRKLRPIFLIDIAVPRNIDPALAKWDDIYVYDIDDLQNVVASGMAHRQKEAQQVELMIEEQVTAFEHWRVSQDGVRLIASLQKKANAVQDAVLDSLFHKLPSLDERERKVVQKHLQSVVNQLLREPIASVKAFSQMEDGKEQLEIIARAFGLETAVESQSEANHFTVNHSPAPVKERQDQFRVIGTLSTI